MASVKLLVVSYRRHCWLGISNIVRVCVVVDVCRVMHVIDTTINCHHHYYPFCGSVVFLYRVKAAWDKWAHVSGIMYDKEMPIRLKDNINKISQASNAIRV